jgi:Flp pilus assembly protein TadG
MSLRDRRAPGERAALDPDGVPPRLRRLAGAESGAVAVIFALTFSAIFLAVAVAIDYARTQTEVVRLQNAVDAAALAASHRLGLPDRDVSGRQDADAYFKVNTVKHQDVGVLKDVVMEADNGEVVATAKGNMFTSLLKAIGIKNIGFGSGATVKQAKGTVEVALVLDNSGSMAGQAINDLIVAAKNLTSVLYAGYEGTDKVRVGVVPFAGSVNVGATYQGAAWIDSGGLSPVHYENFAEQRTRFQLFNALGVGWGGCVEVRPSPHDVTDSVPTQSLPASLFVPMFAPDEPDLANAEGNGYSNTYLSDTGGRCVPPTPTCVHTSRRGRCSSWSTPALPAAEAQARTCKYDGGTVAGAAGPNAFCDSRPILPLTESKSAVEAVLGQMRAKGSTNILDGLMWGWRLLSPEEPFTEGRSYSDLENSKYLILMTDGENSHQAAANHNKSIYHAFGYASNGRLGSAATSSALIGQMNTKTRAACANAKAAGITVYTIAFRLESDATTRALLASCATSAAEAYAASNGADLVQAFEAIAREIAKLRIAG